MTIYFTSETFFNSAACLQSRPERLKRWKTPEKMTNALVAAWNKQVRNTDVVYHLGNVLTGTDTEAVRVLARLNGKKFLVPSAEDLEHYAVLTQQNWRILPQICSLDDEKLVLAHYPLLRWPNDAKWKLIYGLPDERMPGHQSICAAVELFDFAPVSLVELRNHMTEAAFATVCSDDTMW